MNETAHGADYLDLKGVFLPADGTDPLLDDAIAQPPKTTNQPKRRKRAERLQRLPSPFVRVPVAWLKPTPRKRALFDPPARLFLFVLYKSHWGQVGVNLTGAVSAEIGMSPRSKNRNLKVLERTGRVRVERKGRTAAIVWPIVLS